jgi:hypothetical protein
LIISTLKVLLKHEKLSIKCSCILLCRSIVVEQPSAFPSLAEAANVEIANVKARHLIHRNQPTYQFI